MHTCRAYPVDKPTIPGLNVSLSITENNAEKKIIKLPIISNLTATQLKLFQGD